MTWSEKRGAQLRSWSQRAVVLPRSSVLCGLRECPQLPIFHRLMWKVGGLYVLLVLAERF